MNVVTGFLLIIMYSNNTVVVERVVTEEWCNKKSQLVIGELLPDSKTKPAPHALVAYCVKGSKAE